jgi:putative mRNA 3-end processing factor
MIYNAFSNSLFLHTNNGFYCPDGDFYIDPIGKVNKAVVTHAHSDHARYGSEMYLSHKYNEFVMKKRISENIVFEGLEYKQVIKIGGLKLSLYPSGHIPGASMVLIENNKGERCLFSGDYKTMKDGVSTPIEIPKSHHFITESTFALPVFSWAEQEIVAEQIYNWIAECFGQKITPVISAYALGKAQRIIQILKQRGIEVWVHPIIESMNLALNEVNYPVYFDINKPTKSNNVVVLIPPSIAETSWLHKFKPYEIATVSGWMALRGFKKRMNITKGFIMSDHADWNGILKTVKETGAHNIYINHGYSHILARYLNELNFNAVDLNSSLS